MLYNKKQQFSYCFVHMYSMHYTIDKTHSPSEKLPKFKYVIKRGMIVKKTSRKIYFNL